MYSTVPFAKMSKTMKSTFKKNKLTSTNTSSLITTRFLDLYFKKY